jgi:hypothetical protein
MGPFMALSGHASFSLDVCGLDDRPPFLNFSLVQRAQYLWCVLGAGRGVDRSSDAGVSTGPPAANGTTKVIGRVG